MSNPLNSLKKVKKVPLTIPEISSSRKSPSSTPAPANASNNVKSVSAYDNWEEKGDSSSKEKKPYDFNMGYLKNSPRSNNSSRASFNKHPILGEISPNQAPYKSKIDDSDLIDEFTTKMAVDNMKRNITQNQSISSDKSTSIIKPQAPTDMDLMQIMMAKIKTIESKCAFLVKENRDKDRTISVLQEKIGLMKQSNEHQTKDDLIDKLEEKNLELEEKIAEMEDFLSDYGLVWIGNRAMRESLSHQQQHDVATTNTTRSYIEGGKFRCDYDLMVKNIRELNSLMDESIPDREIVEFRPNGAKFETSSNSIKLSLYSNGIALYDGPFRPFDDSLTRKFCIDIMDGYFPTELQQKHPDGVRFDLVDKRDVIFRSERKSAALLKGNSVFKSKGYRLGSGRIEATSQPPPPLLLPNNTNSQETESGRLIETRLTDNPLTIDQFLQKLPNCVVRNGGNLINIRNDLSNLIRGPTTTTTTTETTTTTIQSPSDTNSISLNRRNIISRIDSSDQLELETNKSNGSSSSKIASLRVKSGEESYLVTMKYTDTIETLKEHIKSIRRGRSQFGEFDLASIHPRKFFKNLKLTIEQCDLIPNSNILLIPRNN